MHYKVTLKVWVLGLRVDVSGFRVQVLGCRVKGRSLAGSSCLPSAGFVWVANLPGQWLQCQANGSNVCRVLRVWGTDSVARTTREESVKAHGCVSARCTCKPAPLHVSKRTTHRSTSDAHVTRKVDVRLPGKGNSNSHGARPVHLIITMIRCIRTSRLSIKNSLSWCGHQVRKPL